MIVVNVVISCTPVGPDGKTPSSVQVNILRREDATDTELQMAKAVGKMMEVSFAMFGEVKSMRRVPDSTTPTEGQRQKEGE